MIDQADISSYFLFIFFKNYIKNKKIKKFKKNNNRLSKKSCGVFIEFSIVHKIGYHFRSKRQ